MSGENSGFLGKLLKFCFSCFGQTSGDEQNQQQQQGQFQQGGQPQPQQQQQGNQQYQGYQQQHPQQQQQQPTSHQQQQGTWANNLYGGQGGHDSHKPQQQQYAQQYNGNNQQLYQQQGQQQQNGQSYSQYGDYGQQQQQQQGGQIRTPTTICAFNVKFLFDSKNQDRDLNPYENDPHGAQKHIENIAEVISKLDADMVSLEEVEDEKVMDKLISCINRIRPSGYESYFLKGKDKVTGQNTALLSKLEPSGNLSRNNTRVDYPIPGSAFAGSPPGSTGLSKHYIAKFDQFERQFGFKLAIVGVHFRAMPTGREEREAQAVVLNMIIEELVDHGYEVITLGDFNDKDNQIQDASLSQGMSRAMDIIENGGRVKMINLMNKIPPKERYTQFYDKNHDGVIDTKKEVSAIDHILVTQGMEKALIDITIPHHLSDPTQKYASDHWPIKAVFDFTQYKQTQHKQTQQKHQEQYPKI